MTAPRTWTITLPNQRPPLTANQRGSWRVRDHLRAQLITDTRWLVRGAKIGRLSRCCVGLHYAPPDRRRRDADNLAPTLKVICDALVLEGVVPDDTPDLMVKSMPTIEPVERPGRLWVVVTDLSDQPPALGTSTGDGRPAGAARTPRGTPNPGRYVGRTGLESW